MVRRGRGVRDERKLLNGNGRSGQFCNSKDASRQTPNRGVAPTSRHLRASRHHYVSRPDAGSSRLILHAAGSRLTDADILSWRVPKSRRSEPR
jgi:hypothetical protein